METYLIEMRQVDGGRNRSFLDDRVAVVSGELGKAEEKLKEFRVANRRVDDSPDLLLQQDRLKRDVLMQEQIFLELQRQKEVAKIEEVKNTPVLNVLDSARRPDRPSRPRRVILVAMGFALGLLAAVSGVVLRTALELSPALAAALRPLGRDFAFLGRLLGPKRAAPPGA